LRLPFIKVLWSSYTEQMPVSDLKKVVLLQMSDADLNTFALFLKRMSFGEIRVSAQDDSEAYALRSAIDQARASLATAGYNPR
jgi:hypothetical protein